MDTFIIVILFLYCKTIESVEVKVEEGILEGEILNSITGDQEYYSFKGIPYAAPPVGELRFMAPQPPSPWEGVKSAKQHRSICVQNPKLTYEESLGKENCLFLNIYTPDLAPSCPLPVMVFIPGGSFQFGSGNSDVYGPDFLIKYDVILVTMNYRLGILGFLNLDIKEVPGNSGLKDQVAALRWIKKNIESFGGDPDNVTIFGQSSGASSVTLHLMSPMSKGLFRRAIAMSRGLLNDAVRPFESKERGFAVAKQLGLDTKNATEVFKFLQSLPSKKIRGVSADVLLSEKALYDLRVLNYFTPVLEKDFGDEQFLPKNPINQLKCGDFDCVDFIIGHTSLEGLYKVMTLKSVMFKYYPRYRELLVPLKISYASSPKNVLKLSSKIYQYYFGNNSIDTSSIGQLVDFYTYYNYVYDVHRFLEKWSRKCSNTYFYYFTGFSDRNYYGKQGAKLNITGASHADDLFYLFTAKKLNLPLNKNSEAFKIIDNICTLYTNFAKYGNPTPDNSLCQMWPPYTTNNAYLAIDAELSTDVVTDDGQLGFWKSLLEAAGIKY